MRKNWKKLVSLVLTAACTMVVTVAPVFADAASTPAYSPVEASTVDSLLSSSVQWVGQSLMTYSDDDLANMEASDQQFYARAAEAWEECRLRPDHSIGAPAGIGFSGVRSARLPSASSAQSSIPSDKTPASLAGFKFTRTITFLPTISSGE